MDRIAELFTSIRNAYINKKNGILVFHSKFKENLLLAMKRQSFIKDIDLVVKDKKKYISIGLLYINPNSNSKKNNRIPFLNGIEKVSKLSLRKYISYKDIKTVFSNNGCFILSTNKGILTSLEAKKLKVGGELIGKFW